MKPIETVLVEWDDDAEDYEEVWTEESAAQFWADESKRSEEMIAEARANAREDKPEVSDPES